MTRAGRVGLTLILMLLSLGISLGFGLELAHNMHRGAVIDFQSLFFPTRCLLQHQDPYDLRKNHEILAQEAIGHPPGFVDHPQAQSWFVYPPTASLVIAPMALFPWAPMQVLWTALLAGSLFLAVFLVWHVSCDYAPNVALLLGCTVLANSEVLIGGGNPAGVVVGFCSVAAWCFLANRAVLPGILAMVVSLAIKPHDAGLVWLYFLLAGGLYRKRALQVLSITAVLAGAASLWFLQVSPHWFSEWLSNLASTSAPGMTNDPGVNSIAGIIIDLPAIIAVFHDSPRFYNSLSILICGSLLVVWSIVTLRQKPHPDTAWFALAAIAPLTLLVTYHRPYDAKILLLAIPACAMLWSHGGRVARSAMAVTSAAIILTSDLPLAILQVTALHLQLHTDTLAGKLMIIVLTRPAPLALLVMSGFYVWIYWDRNRSPDARSGAGESKTILLHERT